MAEPVVETKPWWNSVVVWGGLITIASSAASAFAEVEIDPATQSKIALYIVEITSALGGLIAIYGRVRAAHKGERITMTKQ